MPELVTDCPRCSAARITFDILADVYLFTRYDWQTHNEVLGKCRHCQHPTIFRVELSSIEGREIFNKDGSFTSQKRSLNDLVRVVGPVTIRDVAASPPPDLVPDNIASIFKEGSSSFSAGCYNAAAAMFRLVIDLTTKARLPDETETGIDNPPNRQQRRELAARLEWLFETGRLPRDLEELATCIREHGNDGAHDGTITKIDAEDLLDFSRVLLERIFTEPGRLSAARERRAQRRG